LLLKFHKELFSYGDGVGCIKWDKGNWNPRMEHLQQG